MLSAENLDKMLAIGLMYCVSYSVSPAAVAGISPLDASAAQSLPGRSYTTISATTGVDEVAAAAALVSCCCRPVRPVVPPPLIAAMVSSQMAVWEFATADSALDPSAVACACTSLT